MVALKVSSEWFRKATNASVITEKSYDVEFIKKVIKKKKPHKVLKTKERGTESTFSLKQVVEEDLRGESAISQKEKHDNTILNRRLLQPRSNLEQNRLLLS